MPSPFGFVVVAVDLTLDRLSDCRCRFLLFRMWLDVDGGVAGHRDGHEVRCVDEDLLAGEVAVIGVERQVPVRDDRGHVGQGGGFRVENKVAGVRERLLGPDSR